MKKNMKNVIETGSVQGLIRRFGNTNPSKFDR